MVAAANSEKPDGPTTAWLKEQAKKMDAAITGSVIIEENGSYFNRLIWAEPGGRLLYYDKRHLFRMAQEHQTYTPGHARLEVEWRGWKICPLVCYDLRFPVWSRNTTGYDLLLYVANWPEKRSHAWNTLLQARAIENLCYAAGVNRVGTDGNGIKYSGDSALISPTGEVIERITDRAGIINQALSYSELQEYRERFPAHLDADQFELAGLSAEAKNS
jgi:omega-amidase